MHMTLLELVKNDTAAAVTALTGSAVGTITTDQMLQRLSWTLAILVSVAALVRYAYRLYKWWKDMKIEITDED